MIDRKTKLRYRRLFRQKYRQVEDLSTQAEEGLEQHFIKRLGNLLAVRRFVVTWVLLMVLLIAGSIYQLDSLSSYYQELGPAPGGTYTEGVVGMFTNANPLYATGTADSAVSRLVFSGLMKYDQNNQLVGDLAEKLDVDERGNRYTVTLRPNLRWQDGQPLTSADVLYTYQTIQNPDARSPLFGGFKGIQIEAPDAHTIIFSLPTALSSFPHALTSGIVPRHLLQSIPPGQLRAARFNTAAPVGSGPFKWQAIEVTGTSQDAREERIGLIANEFFYRQPAKLQQFIIRTFRDESRMMDAYERGELIGMTGLTSLPDNIRSVSNTHEHRIPLTAATMVFFKLTQEPFTDVKVRQALTQAVDVPKVLKTLGYPAIIVRGPLLSSQIGYAKDVTQLPFDTLTAQRLLDEAGWRAGADGVRAKDGRPLTFQLFAQSTSEYAAVTAALQKAWKAIGVDVQVTQLSDIDLQSVVSRHEYSAVLYGISLGTDPDVFAYWHSSQADPNSPSRLNLSEYTSVAADKALEAGRSRSDASVRAAKYRPFLETWRADAPALALYQPHFLYVTRGQVFNFDPKTLNTTADRLWNAENWMIRQEKVTK
jgi:peptide/nickel transport system substrate-binding protein